MRRATRQRGIDYPVAVDSDYRIWRAFDNHYWPPLYFIDADGVVVDSHFGEGRYEESERVIQELLGVERGPALVDAMGIEAEADWDHLRTPETYLGFGRISNFASSDDAVLRRPRTSARPILHRIRRATNGSTKTRSRTCGHGFGLRDGVGLLLDWLIFSPFNQGGEGHALTVGLRQQPLSA